MLSIVLITSASRAEESIAELANTNTAQASFTEFSQILNYLQFQFPTGYSLSATAVANDCKRFISKDLFLGDVGNSIHKTIIGHEQSFPNLLDGGSLNTACRKYSTMTVQQKSLVWVLILTTVAHFESSCNIAAHAKGPNGTANGYFQLHKGAEDKYDGNHGICRKNDSSSPEKSVQCALSMLELQFAKTNGQLFSPISYWDVLRPRGQSQKASLIHAALVKSSFCNSHML